MGVRVRKKIYIEFFLLGSSMRLVDFHFPRTGWIIPLRGPGVANFAGKAVVTGPKELCPMKKTRYHLDVLVSPVEKASAKPSSPLNPFILESRMVQ